MESPCGLVQNYVGAQDRVAQALGSPPGASPGGVEVLLPVPRLAFWWKQAPAGVPVPHRLAHSRLQQRSAQDDRGSRSLLDTGGFCSFFSLHHNASDHVDRVLTPCSRRRRRQRARRHHRSAGRSGLRRQCRACPGQANHCHCDHRRSRQLPAPGDRAAFAWTERRACDGPAQLLAMPSWLHVACSDDPSAARRGG